MIESIRDRKTVEKIIQNRKTAKKIRSKPKTACKTVKTVKTDKFSHPTYKHSNRSDTVVTSGAYRGFAAFQDLWRRIIATQIKEKPKPK